MHKQATEEWLNCWERTWWTIFTEALSEIHQHAFTFTHGDSQEIICNECGHTWGDRTDFDDQARDHVLANCPEALKDIEMAITKCPNLMLLPFSPVGKHVEGRLPGQGDSELEALCLAMRRVADKSAAVWRCYTSGGGVRP